ncbi:MAG: 4-amino-4-deoxy-L-arabinose transferase and related glycosyltransferase of PMT family-like protein [Candidatus Woesebacteria bacterium GW2011_GWB1_43_14]|uniref:4-amino-4-deoxy-L-arabinose transferase and related glycosyltransferase of PMT family-like protein n=1 Tax=Candidatus Woesebacteria bacterium GW2011_GWB1_43_14 TaxID=1618578 RepID=A0A0G1DHC7_9BACT|nr:MAG: 4-amino-4-deoxy-L-arabinose transferase and related glycosyltransferase of PMT family-like protein [Candidatus Woesebacteria bacterium GW2011_GWA1_39_11b]KKS78312.1 MAG: 4-amino-4-deoxy-L-arabinose transferase and related glycosyltransferase of PMT family-like protein [Candidatus Woesebacteria bacterium GW2011_GWC1_42_9]KKS97270.1 MAG: 4-amino-4-deoxy-L-arabinose transferase and related glycosyltransferase of PMT family-like protein [Candidatus Woesebacteria bacterium GW2011_GWB1_43_14]
MEGYLFKDVREFIKKNYLILTILLLGFFFRAYRSRELFMYSHDQDLLGWFIKDVLINHDLRLVGQETSIKGIYIGPFFYYLLIPFYLIFKMDPIGGVYFSIILGVISIWSVYFVFSKILSKSIGLAGSFIYAISFYTVFTDREVVPTTPAMLWTVWYLYGLHLLLGKQRRGFLLLGVLIGLIWNINLGLAVSFPLILYALFLRRKIDLVGAFKGFIAGVFVASPLIIFELRNGFQQIKSAMNNVGGGGTEFPGVADKFDRVMQLVVKNVSSLIWGSVVPVSQKDTFSLVMLFLVVITFKKMADLKILKLIWAWIILYILFFSTNSIILSEYYLNGVTIVWILILAIALEKLYEKPILRIFGLMMLLGFFSINIYRLFQIDINKSGYIDRRALVSFIKNDASNNSYPCVSVSYITKPGYDLGYRYLFWLEGMHVNQPISGSPVYTIVFPHSMVDKIDQSFGALGLVLPDYEKYNMREVVVSCSGENSNLTDPLFGFSD